MHTCKHAPGCANSAMPWSSSLMSCATPVLSSNTRDDGQLAAQSESGVMRTACANDLCYCKMRSLTGSLLLFSYQQIMFPELW
jgi:hypothetical protein